MPSDLDATKATPDAAVPAPPVTPAVAREDRWQVLDNKIVITDGEGNTYRFKIPTMADYAAIGSRAAFIRRVQDPMGQGLLSSLDPTTADLIWGFAAFELLLDKTSIEWPVSKDDQGMAVVDHRKFPLDRMTVFMEVVVKLDQALNRFRAGRTAD